MDRKVVMVMSSNFQSDGVGAVLRRQQDGSRIPVTCPECIINYNQYMGGGVWIVETSSVATIAAEQRAGSFTNSSSPFCSM